MNLTANKLYNKISKYDRFASKDVINKAFVISKKAHANQYRSSGEKYFTHPLAVANVLIDMKLDSSTIITALLHDVVEDSDVSLDLIKNEFVEEISKLVDGFNKLSILYKRCGSAQTQNFRMLLLASSDDIIVI